MKKTELLRTLKRSGEKIISLYGIKADKLGKNGWEDITSQFENEVINPLRKKGYDFIERCYYACKNTGIITSITTKSGDRYTNIVPSHILYEGDIEEIPFGDFFYDLLEIVEEMESEGIGVEDLKEIRFKFSNPSFIGLGNAALLSIGAEAFIRVGRAIEMLSDGGSPDPITLKPPKKKKVEKTEDDLPF